MSIIIAPNLNRSVSGTPVFAPAGFGGVDDLVYKAANWDTGSTPTVFQGELFRDGLIGDSDPLVSPTRGWVDGFKVLQTAGIVDRAISTSPPTLRNTTWVMDGGTLGGFLAPVLVNSDLTVNNTATIAVNTSNNVSLTDSNLTLNPGSTIQPHRRFFMNNSTAVWDGATIGDISERIKIETNSTLTLTDVDVTIGGGTGGFIGIEASFAAGTGGNDLIIQDNVNLAVGEFRFFGSGANRFLITLEESTSGSITATDWQDPGQDDKINIDIRPNSRTSFALSNTARELDIGGPVGVPWAQALWDNDQLTHNGQTKTDLGGLDWLAVTSPYIGFGNGEYFSFTQDGDFGGTLQTLPVGWSPKEEGAEAWYDSSDASTVTELAGLVSQLDDKSGNAYHLVQGVASNQPSVASLNGRTALGFDGLSEYIEEASGTGRTYSNGITLFSVYNPDIVETGDTRPFGIRADIGFADSQSFAQSADSTLRFDGAQSAGLLPPTSDAVIRTSTKSADNDVQKDWINGVSNIDSTVDLNTTTNGLINIGNSNWTFASGVFFEGQFGESIVLPFVASTAQRHLIEGYLAWKWNLVADLPVGHPYKFAPPGYDSLWTPAELNTIGWYDAADTSTISAGVNGVTQWSDKSGNGYHMVANALGADEQFKTGTNTLGGRNVLFSSNDPGTGGRQKGLEMLTPVPTVNNKFRAYFLIHPTGPSGADGAGSTSRALQVTGPDNLVNVRGANGGFQGRALDGSGTDILSDPLGMGTVIQLGSYVVEDDQFFFYSDAEQVSGLSTMPDGFFGTTVTYAIGDTSGVGGNAGWAGSIAEYIMMTGDEDPNERTRIEGYLAWKWGQEALLPSGHPYELRPPLLGDAWTPLQLTTLGWWDASDEATITDDGSNNVTVWEDKSGNGYDFFVPPMGIAKQTGLETLNGLNTISTPSGGPNNRGLKTGNIAAPIIDDKMRAYYAADITDGFGSSRFLTFQFSTHNLRINGADTNMKGRLKKDSATVIQDLFMNEEAQIGALRVDDATAFPNDARFQKLGATEEVATLDQTTLLAANLDGVTIGSTNGANSDYEGNLGEVIIMTGDESSDEKELIEGYMAWKWGLEGLLPSGHPYEDGAPFVVKPVLSAWTPQQLSGKIAWWDANDASTVEYDGATNQVATWSEKSVNQLTARPVGTYPDPALYGTRTMNGVPVVDFVGGAPGTGGPLGTTLDDNVTLGPYFTVFMVMSADTDVTTSDGFFGHQGAAGAINIFANSDADSYSIIYRDKDPLNPPNGNVENEVIEAGVRDTAHIVCVRTPSDTVDGDVRLDGNVDSTIDFTSFTPSASAGDFFLGAIRNNLTTNGNGIIGEILVVNRRMEDYEVELVEGYLAWKWSGAIT